MKVSDRHRRVPLAPVQRGLYFLHRLAPASAVYNVPVALLVRGPLDIERLRGALKVLMCRHQALRTTIEDDGTQISQLIRPLGPRLTVPLRVHETAGGELRADPGAWAARVAAQPFDLSRGPLWRVDMACTGAAEQVLVLSFHHIVVDEVSAEILADELRTVYADPEAADRSEPAHGYDEFCAAGDMPEQAGLDYWRSRMAGLEPFPLPSPHSALQSVSFVGDRVGITLSEADTARLGDLCRTFRVSQFMVFYAVLTVLLQRWTGAADIGVGTPVNGRVDPRFERTVGLFQNTVVLRDRISPQASFRELLISARRTVLEALQHQDVPFGTVVEAVRPVRETNRNPLFQVALVYNRTKVEERWRFDGLTVEPLPFPWNISHFDLSLSMVQEQGILKGDFTFNTQRLTRKTVESLAALFPTALAQLAGAPDAPIEDVPEPATGRLDPAPRQPDTTETAGAEAPRNATEQTLVRLFEEVLGVDDIGIHDDFFELGGHSLLAIQLAGRATEELDRPVEVAALMAHPTVARLAGWTAVPSGPVVRLRPGTGDTTLVLIHPVGGTLSCYEPLVRLLPPEVEVVGLERLPGTHPPGEGVEELAGRHTRSLLDAVPPDRTLVLAGWSAGGLLAYAVAAGLSAAERQVSRVVVLDGPARRTTEELDQLAQAQTELLSLAKAVREDVAGAWPGAERLLRQLGVDPETLRQTPTAPTALLLESWAGMLGSMAAYEVPKAPVDVQLVLCADSPQGRSDRIAASWRGLTAGLVTEHVPGDHFSVLRMPAVTRLADMLAAPRATTAEEWRADG